MKSVCKTNIRKNLNESWTTGEIIPINDRWACGITTIRKSGNIEFEAVITLDGITVTKVSAYCHIGTPKNAIFTYCIERFLPAYQRYSTFDTIDFASLDARKMIGSINKHYERLYAAHDNAKGYDEMIEVGDWLIKSQHDFIRRLVHARHDIFSSDREVAALAFAVNELL